VLVYELAIWGFFGAFVYAAPRLLVAWAGGRRTTGTAECIIALAIGAIGSAGFTQFIGDVVRQSQPADLRAIAVVLGMISNPVAPSIVHLMGTGLVRRLGGTNIRARH